MRYILSLALIAAFGLGLTACGSDPNITTQTKGQQIMDLQNAYQSRAITDDEYKEQKEQVLDK